MEQYGRFEEGKPLVLRLGSGKVDEDQRLLMLLPEPVFGKSGEFLRRSVEEGLAKVIRDLTDEQAGQCILNEDENGAITTAPLQSARAILYDGQNIKKQVYIASASPNGVPRVGLQDRLASHVAYNDGTGQQMAFNILNLVVNTEKDTQGYF